MDTRTVKSNVSVLSPTVIIGLIAMVVIGTGMVGAVVFRNQWLPKTSALWTSVTASSGDANTASAEDDHAGLAHAGDDHVGHNPIHAGHDEGNSLELSPQARKNIGLQAAAIKLQAFFVNDEHRHIGAVLALIRNLLLQIVFRVEFQFCFVKHRRFS